MSTLTTNVSSIVIYFFNYIAFEVPYRFCKLHTWSINIIHLFDILFNQFLSSDRLQPLGHNQKLEELRVVYINYHEPLELLGEIFFITYKAN